jgi:hypothetical protein
MCLESISLQIVFFKYVKTSVYLYDCRLLNNAVEFTLFYENWRFTFCTLLVFLSLLSSIRGTRWRSLLRHCATSRKVAGPIPDGFIDIILSAALWPWGRLRLQQKWVPGMFPGSKGGRCVGLTTLPPSCADCLEIWKPQPPGTLWACPGL